jgi:hypothetical protein
MWHLFSSNHYYVYITTKSRDSEQTSFCARYSEHSEHRLKILNILNIDGTDSEHSEQSLNITEQILNITENSEQSLNILNIYHVIFHLLIPFFKSNYNRYIISFLIKFFIFSILIFLLK